MDEVTSKIVADWFRKKYRKIDQDMTTLSYVCKKGCDWCCYQSIEILNWEEPLILNYISEKISIDQKLILEEKLTDWFNYFDTVMPRKSELSTEDVFIDFHNAIAKDQIACLFLENHMCGIYPVRPISCRMHIANDGPLACMEDALKDSSFDAEQLRKKYLAEISEKLPTSLGLLNFSVAKILGLSHRIRKVEENLLEGIY